ncbi:MAG: DUF4145 domain-containing protein [Candidatus Taylorbacteria bacterium]|nr:DUF4145 domain-containing protein [Candidatus Taylorbacteria bacterium]
MNYICPYCSHDTTITDPNKFSFWKKIYIEKSTLGEVGFGFYAITCPNKDCKRLKLGAQLTGVNSVGERSTKVVQEWQLLPESDAKVLPDYIPEPIKEDYYQSCRIRDLSPKASATLARRCLQGMIRDFYNISKVTLFDEIRELENKVDPDVWESIDAVRQVGNIGAHMKKDINIIIDVQPEEAQLLIGLIEQLVDEWYVAREERKKRAEKLKNLAASKKV